MMIEMSCGGGCPRVGRPRWAVARKSKLALLTPRLLCTKLHQALSTTLNFAPSTLYSFYTAPTLHCSVASAKIKNIYKL